MENCKYASDVRLLGASDNAMNGKVTWHFITRQSSSIMWWDKLILQGLLNSYDSYQEKTVLCMRWRARRCKMNNQFGNQQTVWRWRWCNQTLYQQPDQITPPHYEMHTLVNLRILDNICCNSEVLSYMQIWIWRLLQDRISCKPTHF